MRPKGRPALRGKTTRPEVDRRHPGPNPALTAPKRRSPAQAAPGLASAKREEGRTRFRSRSKTDYFRAFFRSFLRMFGFGSSEPEGSAGSASSAFSAFSASAFVMKPAGAFQSSP